MPHGDTAKLRADTDDIDESTRQSRNVDISVSEVAWRELT